MAKQKLGQHFLFDKNILKKIAFLVQGYGSKGVLEIGAGLGTLTEQLIDLFEHTYTVELDKSLYNRLVQKFGDNKKVTIINDDILNVNIEALPVSIAVGNIPYYITTPIIFKLLEAANIKQFSLLMQKEVATRIVAKPGSKDYGILSVNVQYQSDVNIAFKVNKGSFSPPPKVDSLVVTFSKKDTPLQLTRSLRILTQKAFGMRRKTLFNNLKGLLGEDTAEFIKQFGIAPTARAEEIDVETFVKMTETLIKKGALSPLKTI